MPPLSPATFHLPFGALCFLGVLLLIPTHLSAQQAPPPRIAFAPDVHIFLTSPDADPAEELPAKRHDLRATLLESAHREWRTQSLDVHLVDLPTLHTEITDASLYDGTLALARQWGELGVTAYKEVQPQTAVNHLERALQNFQTISHDLVEPDEMAEFLMFLALSYLEDGTDVVRPLELLQEMIRRNPDLRLEEGFYPDFIVRYYQSAHDTLLRQLRQDGPPLDETRRIAELTDADYVFHTYALVHPDHSTELIAYLFDRADDDFLPLERIEIPHLSPQSLADASSRLVSRLAACLVDTPDLEDPSTLSSSQGTGRLSLQLTLNYGSFFQTPAPVRDPFGNYGVGIGAAWSLTREFQLIGSAQVFNSLRDFQGILRDDFTTLRLSLGGHVGRDFQRFHFGLGAGAEMAVFGPIRVFTDPACIPAPDLLCPGDTGTLTYQDRPPHLGVFLRPRIAFALARSVELSAALSLGYYFAPLDDRLLNFPLTTEFGFNYRF